MTNFQGLYTWLQAKALGSERGAGMAEYALILTLVAVVAALGFTALGTAIDTLLDTVAASIN